MAVRSKVRCTSLIFNVVTFSTVYEPDRTKNEENARFTKETPWGDIRMWIDDKVLLEQFEVNKEYYVDFTSAETPITKAPVSRPAQTETFVFW